MFPFDIINNSKDQLISRPVWDWSESFTDKDIVLFSNPLYKKPPMSEVDLEHHRKSKLPQGALKLPGMDILPVKMQPKQRFSVQPGGIDANAKLLLPSQILNHSIEPVTRSLKTTISNEVLQVIATISCTYISLMNVNNNHLKS